MAEAAIRAAFAAQADFCGNLGSPFTALLCDTLGERLDRSTRTGKRALGWHGDPLADALPLRLTGALHALVRRGRLPGLASKYPPAPLPEPERLAEALAVALADADAELLPWLESPPQTNEVGRSAVLYAGLLVAAAATPLPLSLFELGASAGLNLRLDDYAYELCGGVAGNARSAVRLAPAWTGAPPPDARVLVAARRGVDLNPLDVTDPATRERLLAYVWPDQPERQARLAAALDAAAADPPPLDQGDAADWIERLLTLEPGVATIVFHSIAFIYFPAAVQARIAARIESLGAQATADAPLGWLRYEFAQMGAAPTLRLRLWPGGGDRLLASVHPHGAVIDWRG